MNLILDFGNSTVKLAIIDEENKSDFQIQQFEQLSLEKLQTIVSKHTNLKHVILSSVINVEEEIANYLQTNFGTFIELSEQTPLPIENLYQSKSTLGKDRLAAIVGAYDLFPNSNTLVIDAGTAITFDFINSQNQYLGGNISPGLQTRFKSLHTFTEKLPLLSKQDNNLLLGNNTESAIVSGVQNGILLEIDGFINLVKEEYQDLKIILTGGDTFFFDNKLKNTIFAEPKLVLIGLNNILNFNVEKN